MFRRVTRNSVQWDLIKAKSTGLEYLKEDCDLKGLYGQYKDEHRIVTDQSKVEVLQLLEEFETSSKDVS